VILVQRTIKRAVLALLLGLSIALGATAGGTLAQQSVVANNPGGGHGGTGG